MVRSIGSLVTRGSQCQRDCMMVRTLILEKDAWVIMYVHARKRDGQEPADSAAYGLQVVCQYFVIYTELA